MRILSGRWKTVAFTLASVIIGLTALEGLTAFYFFLEDRYWPHIVDPGPIKNQADRKSFMEAILSREPTSPEDLIIMQMDDETGWALKPTEEDGFLGQRINSLGLRGREIESKAPEELRLLFLGDSSIYGFGASEPQTMPESAARDLNSRLGRPVSGVNGGVPGYDSGQSLALFARVVDQVDPDWVVIGALWSDCYAERGLQMDEDGAPRSLLSKSNLYRLMRRLLEPLLSSRKVGWFASEEEMFQATVEDARTTPDQYLTNLVAMAQLARDSGATPLFLILPAPVDLTRRGPPDIAVEYRKLMRNAAQKTGALVVDGPSLLAPRGVQLHHFLDQVHPGPELQQLLGIAVSRTIAEQAR